MTNAKKEGAGQMTQRRTNTYIHSIAFLTATVKGEKLKSRIFALLFRLSLAVAAAAAVAALVFPVAWAERGCTDAIGGEHLLVALVAVAIFYLTGVSRHE